MTQNEGIRTTTFAINCELESVVACAKVAQSKLAALNDRIQEAEDRAVAGTLSEAEADYDALLERLKDNPTTNQPSEPPVHTEPPAMPSNATLRKQARQGENRPPAWWWRATDDPFKPVSHPAPPIEVEMRVVGLIDDQWTWQCQLAGSWLRLGNCYFGPAHMEDDAQAMGNAWLAALSEKLRVPLVAKWVSCSRNTGETT